MDEESVTDSESESKSESEAESSDNDRETRGKKRKMKTETKAHNSKRQAKDLSQYFRDTTENRSELPVTCGRKEGVLHVEKYDNGQKCIFSEDQWFFPSEFERFGGKERSKKWKTSICSNGFPLQKLIEDGFLSSFTRIRARNEQDDSTRRLGRKKKVRRQPSSSSSESDEMDDDENDDDDISDDVDDDDDDNDNDDINDDDVNDNDNNNDDNDVDNNDDDIDGSFDKSMFEGPKLPVNCGSDSGVLHKCRFATGRCGRCIRTKDSWMTPEDFIRLNRPKGIWRKDIVSHGIPLGKLIMERVLQPHTVNCDCEVCIDLDQYQNDDECFVCDSEEGLVCCDECPRAFHRQCHLPAEDEDLPDEWSCTFCAVKKMKASSQKTLQEALGSPVSQYTLHCQYLLLLLLHESRSDSCRVPGFREKICDPQNLGRVKLKLENDRYKTVREFVSDIMRVFKSCRDSGFGSIASRLKDLFNTESENIFKLQ